MATKPNSLTHLAAPVETDHEPLLKKLRFTRDVMKRARMDGKSCLMSIWEQDLAGVEEAIEILSSDGGVENRRHAARGLRTPKTAQDGQEGGPLGSAPEQGHPEEHIAGVASGPSDHFRSSAETESDRREAIAKSLHDKALKGLAYWEQLTEPNKDDWRAKADAWIAADLEEKRAHNRKHPLPVTFDQPQVAPTQTFYGARCPSYPNCSGGCGLGCVHEMELEK